MQITIDRIEGDQVVAELPDMSLVTVPISLFPGAKEGDVYNISKGEREAVERQKRIQDKFGRLKEG